MAKKKEKTLQDEIIDVCLRRGIIFPTAEIYGGAAGFFEYGPVGEAVRQNIINLWQETFINSEDNMYQISGSTILPEKVFAASGHLDAFHDPLTQCRKCKSMYRVDHIIEEQTGLKVEGKSIDEITEILNTNEVTCTRCKSELIPPREFNMMFSTNIGATEGNSGYLRPETAQNIFLNFRRISHSMRAKLPFGIAQIGKAYRNEISPRNFLIRMREFEQMEIEMFVDPEELNAHPSWDEMEEFEITFLSHDAQENGEKAVKIKIKDAVEQGLVLNQYLAYYMVLETEFLINLGINPDTFWFRHLLPHETAHYSKANYDLEIQFPFGIVEVIGLAYRSDYDLLKHQEKSNTKLHIDVSGKKVIPHVVEPSFGVSRLVYAVLLAAYQKEGRDWTWFKFPGAMAPWEVLVAPLMKKDGLAEAAKVLYWELKDQGIDVIFDQSGAIGRRYARADEIGIPLAITYDYESLEDDTVTIRNRDTTEQIRAPSEELPAIIREYILEMVNWKDLVQEYGLIESSPKKK
ncbi:MAG: glycine--tRNA ligase [Candidatus Kariarchaeaceae archaeon]|jgi:glycyl-tRNA synthetase